MDTFVRDNLPPLDQWPELLFELPELQYPRMLNCTTALLDAPLLRGRGECHAFILDGEKWTYRELHCTVCRIANFLVADLGLIPGNRVLLRGANSPMLAALWLAVVRAGGVAVTTMPMLRAAEIGKIVEQACVELAICEASLKEELGKARALSGCPATVIIFGDGEFENRIATKSQHFEAMPTTAVDPALIAFTSGTTGNPKAAVHFHRDILAVGDTFGRYILKPRPDDVFLCTAPLAFTFGLGMELLFPLRAGACTVFVRDNAPASVAKALELYRVSCLATAPTAYRSLLADAGSSSPSFLRKCVSAGEALPAAVSNSWFETTGIRLIDGLGSTELLHICVSAAGDAIIPGSTGSAVPGYRACVMDVDGAPVDGPGVGHLAVKGPTGCRYLADRRQLEYVRNGWNVTGDLYRVDSRGYFWFESRTDDMIISSGYNVAGLEVEGALLQHEAVSECAVVGVPDLDRGSVVTAYVVPKKGTSVSGDLAKALQEFVKQAIAPYKYPRRIHFVNELPRTATGKIQRFKLREQRMRAVS